jgi:hypothetical protein
VLDQDPDSFGVTKKRRERKRREPIVARHIGIRTAVEQRANRGCMPAARSTHQRRHAVFVTRININAAQQHCRQLTGIAVLRHAPQVACRSIERNLLLLQSR